jgi:hypothetical protein
MIQKFIFKMNITLNYYIERSLIEAKLAFS